MTRAAEQESTVEQRFEVSREAAAALAKYFAETPAAEGKGVRVFFSGFG